MNVIMTAPRLADQAVALIEAAGGTLHYMQPYPTAEAVADLARALNPVAILSRQGPVGAAAMDAAPALRIVARHGVGVEDVDIPAATARGITVTRAPGSNTRAVAEHTMALVLALVKDVAPLSRHVAGGGWRGATTKVRDVAGLRLGLLGLGAIGQAVAQLGQAFGMQVHAFDPAPAPASQGPAAIHRVSSPAALWPVSDVLSLHLPYTPATRHIVDAAALAALPQGAIVVNTARGGLIDEAALLAALDTGHVAGAGLDVFETEPPLQHDPPARPCPRPRHPARRRRHRRQPGHDGRHGGRVHRGRAPGRPLAPGPPGGRVRLLRARPQATDTPSDRQRTYGPRSEGLRAWALGLLAALALPPLHVIPVLFVAVPGLLALIGRAPTGWRAARLGFWFGFGQHLVGLYWITEAILLESDRYWWLVPIAVPALAALLSLFIAAPAWIAHRAHGWRRVATLAGAWVLFDLARQFVGTGFPWNPWGSVWAVPGAFGDTMIQPAAWIGTPGLTLLTVGAAGLPWLGIRGALLAAAGLVAWAAAGTWRLHDPDPPAPGLVAVLVQGNVVHGALRDRASAEAAFNRELTLTAQGVAQAAARSAARPGAAPSIVIWPESAGIYLLEQDPAARAAIAAAARGALGTIVGSLRWPDRQAPPWNSMLILAPDGTVVDSYDKWHLVPFGEFAPSWVPLSIQIVPGQFAFGTGPKTLRLPGLPPFGGLICYETIYPGQVVNEADRPDWLVNVTNDSWFGNSTGPRQHLSGSRLRAVEEGLPLMRAANTGISAGFDCPRP